MNKNIPILRKSILFKDMTDSELEMCLLSLSFMERKYKKASYILHSEERTEYMGFILEGSVTIEACDLWGNRSILSYVGKGDFFAETYAFLRNEALLVDVLANEDSRILFFKIGHISQLITQIQSKKQLWLVKLINNLLHISAHKNLLLSKKNFHLSAKTIRRKLMAYLNTVSLQKQSLEFDIKFDRQQLADYLAVERTALSKELSKMQKEKIISVNKNHFILHKNIT